MALSFSTRVATPSHVLVQQLEGEAVLLNVNSGHYFGLDAVGSRFWDLLQSGETIQSAYDAMLQQYDVGPDQLRGDLTDLLTKLVDHGLLEVAHE